MIKHLLSITILAFICAFSISELSAQKKTEERKVVIVEKEVDDNGVVTEKKVVKTGAEADEYIKKMQLEEGSENTWTTDKGEEIDLEGKSYKKVEKKQYKVRVQDENGEEKELTWDGEGEMPTEMKELMEKEGLGPGDMGGSQKSRIKIRRTRNGSENQEMEFEYDGNELPEEIKETLEKEGIILEEVISKDGTKEIKVTSKNVKEKDATPKKAQLGVNIEAHPMGVRVSDVLPKSSAAEGGIQQGDIILEVDGTKTKEVVELVNVVSTYKPGDKVKFLFDRGGEKMEKSIVLKEKIDPFPFKTWEQVMNNGKEETIEVEIEQEVMRMKEKK